MAASVPVNSRRRDWFQILRDQGRVGISYAEVGRKCNLTAHAVRGWAEGGDPKEADARVVLALYARHCPLKYLEHSKQFEIRASIEALTVAGESHTLPFIA